jgi:hypothetical protein
MKRLLLFILLCAGVSVAQEKTYLQKAYVDSTIGTEIFSNNGFIGNGWQIDPLGNAVLQSLTLRGRLTVYELIAQQIRVHNGIVFISSTGRIGSAVEREDGEYRIIVDSGSVHGFEVDDIIHAQRFSGQNTFDSWMYVTAVNGTTRFTAQMITGDAPQAGYDYARIGNYSDYTRMGSIFMTSEGAGSPRITVKDGVNSIASFTSDTTSRVVIGKLDGLYDSDLGSLSGYGLFCDNVYLKGELVLVNGELLSTKLSVIEGMISLIVGDSTYNAFDSTITVLTGRLDVFDSLIATRVTQTDFNAFGDTLASWGTDIRQDVNSIQFSVNGIKDSAWIALTATTIAQHADTLIMDGYVPSLIAGWISANYISADRIQGDTLDGVTITGTSFYTDHPNADNNVSIVGRNITVAGYYLGGVRRSTSIDPSSISLENDASGNILSLSADNGITWNDEVYITDIALAGVLAGYHTSSWFTAWEENVLQVDYSAVGHNHNTTYHPLVSSSFTGQVDVGAVTLNFENGVFTGID